MKLKARKLVLTVLMLVVMVQLGGCGILDTARQAARQEEQRWEEELSRAIGEEEDLSTEQTGGTQETEAGDGDAGKTQETSATEETAEDFSFEETSPGHFAYDSLNETEQIWYRNMNRILGRMQEKQELSATGIDGGLDEKCIDKIFQCVLNDHPEYFYVVGYTYTKFTRGDKLVKIEFSGTYSMNRQEAVNRQAEIEAAADVILQGISQDTGDYEKIKYVYDSLIRGTEYDLSAPDNQNIYSVFVNRASVCQGYAKATQFLLNRLGIECTIVMGTVDTGEGHAWNLVRCDGSYYYVDTTWGDASYQTEGSTVDSDVEKLPEINYDYLCVTTEQLLRTHTLGGVVPMPQCVAMDDNYYVREGAYFTTCSEEQLKSFFVSAGESGRDVVTLKCADYNTYVEMNRRLIEEQGIFDFLDNMDRTVAYAQNEKQLSMTFWVTKEG